MHLDIGRQLGAVSRLVGTREHAGKPAYVIVATRTYATTMPDLWDAITNPERLPRWFLPVSGELRLHGRYALEGNASGEITRCEPPRRLALTWEFDAKTSWVEVELSDDPSGGTKLELQHLAHYDDHWEKFGAGAGGVGWDLSLAGLDLHVTSGQAVDPIEAGEWTMSEQGKAFMIGSSEAWAQASIAGGLDPVAAREAAARTKAFYTGEANEG